MKTKIIHRIIGFVIALFLIALTYDLPLIYTIILGGSIIIIVLSKVFVGEKNMIEMFKLSLTISIMGTLMMVSFMGVSTYLKANFVSLFSYANIGQVAYTYYKRRVTL